MSAQRCGCCEGIQPLTPQPTANRAGLEALVYRVGTHGSFLETMVARLSSHRLANGSQPMRGLTTRASDDPAMALLDAWATVLDVLTFYQERIANEGYLGTATERRSVLELARLVGYRLRPGVAAGVYLAFTLEEDYQLEIPQGTPAQSVPGPDELPQVFETAEALEAQSRWNAIGARRTRPTYLLPGPLETERTFYVEGTLSGLAIGGSGLLLCGEVPQPYRILALETDDDADHTQVTYGPFRPKIVVDRSVPDPVEVAPGQPLEAQEVSVSALGRTGFLIEALNRQPSRPPASRFHLERSLEDATGPSADLGPQLLTRFHPRLKDTLYTAYAKASLAGEATCEVQSFAVVAAPFGHNAPMERLVTDGTLQDPTEWTLSEAPQILFLDGVHEGITAGSRVLIDRPAQQQLGDPILATVQAVRTVSRAAYGISGRVTQLVLDRPWLTADDTSLALLRATTVYAQPEALVLVEEPIETDVAEAEIELDGLYDGLTAGRWLMVRGERADLVDEDGGTEVTGVEASELVMLAGVEHRLSTVTDADGVETEIPGDTLHTHLILSEPLAFVYRRDSLKVNANVVRATQGETTREVLGSGDGSRPFQSFELKKPPLTHLSAPTAGGVESTLEVRVDDVEWPEKNSLLELGAAERGFETRTDDEGITRVRFGDGIRGTRIPSGVENVTAVYRSGIGQGGNVDAESITTLTTRPLGVKEVTNPQAASGGADRENRDQARRNVPLALHALDRLVSVDDYAAFAQQFGGIGKASAAELTDGRRQVVHLTLAGADDAHLDPGGDLLRNLLLALNDLGDPNVPLQVDAREVMFLFLSAGVRVREAYLWEKVEPQVRAALLEAFGFESMELGQNVLLSQVIATIQAVEGVDYVDVDFLEGLTAGQASDPDMLVDWLGSTAETSAGSPPGAVVVQPARVDADAAEAGLHLLPAQLAYLNPELPDSLILREVTP